MTEVCIEILNQRWTAWVCELSGIFTKCCVHLQHLKEGSKISLGSQSEPWPKKAVDSLFEKAPVRQTEWAEPNFDSAPRVAPIFPYLEFHSKVCSTHFCCAYHVPEWMKARAENHYKIWSQKMRQTWQETSQGKTKSDTFYKTMLASGQWWRKLTCPAWNSNSDQF